MAKHTLRRPGLIPCLNVRLKSSCDFDHAYRLTQLTTWQGQILQVLRQQFDDCQSVFGHGKPVLEMQLAHTLVC